MKHHWAERAHKLALGLEQSTLPFSGVLRKLPGSAQVAAKNVPDGFNEGLSDRGIISWNGFHRWGIQLLWDSLLCGWNSVVEAFGWHSSCESAIKYQISFPWEQWRIEVCPVFNLMIIFTNPLKLASTGTGCQRNKKNPSLWDSWSFFSPAFYLTGNCLNNTYNPFQKPNKQHSPVLHRIQSPTFYPLSSQTHYQKQLSWKQSHWYADYRT